MAERDLTGDAGQAHEAQRPGRVRRAEADLDQILRLVHLHRVPGEQAAEDSRAAIHQKRAVRIARASVQSTATQAGSTTFAGRAAGGRRVEAGSPSG